MLVRRLDAIVLVVWRMDGGAETRQGEGLYTPLGTWWPGSGARSCDEETGQVRLLRKRLGRRDSVIAWMGKGWVAGGRRSPGFWQGLLGVWWFSPPN